MEQHNLQEEIPNTLAYIIFDNADHPQCWLQWNTHLDGYNFFGGHVELIDQSPADAAVRELLEEVDGELKKKWGIDTSKAPPLPLLQQDILPLLTPLSDSSGLLVTFFSRRRQHEITTVCHYFKLDTNLLPPALLERLAWLEQQHIKVNGNTIPLVQKMNADQLAIEADASLANPFIQTAREHGFITAPATSSTPYLLNCTQLAQALAVIHKRWSPTDHADVSINVTPPNIPLGNILTNWDGDIRFSLEVCLKGQDERFIAQIPYPIEGVFCLQSSDVLTPFTPSQNIWHPCLIEREGYWAIKTKRGDTWRYELRIVTPLHGVKSIFFDDTLSVKKSKNDMQESLGRKWTDRIESKKLPDGTKKTRFLTPHHTNSNLPQEYLDKLPVDKSQWLVPATRAADILANYATDDSSKRIKNCFAYMLDHPADIQWLEAGDLAFSRLYTYSAHILAQYANTLSSIAKSKDFWPSFCKLGSVFARRVFKASALRRSGRLQAFHPINAVDALSRLTALTRYPYPGHVLERLPAEFRQLHPSYKGMLCPFESPESKRVGLTLNLAAGVRTTPEGILTGSTYQHPNWLAVGYAANLAPFVRHNDAPRAMMGAKNVKQAVLIKTPEQPLLLTGGEPLVDRLTKPMQALGLLAACGLPSSLGRNLLVAYMPFDGWNFEDGIVANASLRDSGVMDWVQEESGETYVLPSWSPTQPTDAIGSIFFEGGLLKQGMILSPSLSGARIALLRHADDGDTQDITIPVARSGCLAAIAFEPPPSPEFGGKLTWLIRYNRPLSIGDKLMARHGNKGVITRFVAAKQMPRLPDDPSLPQSLRGRTVDLVLNPNGVISRMNIGQLIETQCTLGLSLAGHAGLFQVSQTLNHSTWPQQGSSLLDVCQRTFKNNQGACDEYGRIQLKLKDGQKTELPVIVGFEYFYRLKQSPWDKANARGTPKLASAYARLTGQPVGGRRLNGGQRLGEMEMFALMAYQANRFLRNTLTIRSSHPDFVGKNKTLKATTTFLSAYKLALSPNAEANACIATQDEPASTLKTVTNSQTHEPFYASDVYCTSCGFKLENLELTETKQRAESADKTEAKATLLSLLAAWQITVPDSVQSAIEKKSTNTFTETFALVCSRPSKYKPKLTLNRTSDMILSGKIELGKRTIALWRRMDPKNNNVGELTYKKVQSMKLCCPNCTLLSKKITEKAELAVSSARLAWRPAINGIFDPSLFGKDEASMAYLDMNGTTIPVLPLCYRRQPPSARRMQDMDKVDILYGKMLSTAPEQSEDAKQTTDLQDQYRDLLKEQLFGKAGLLRRHGLGRRTNRSGRFVIVPAPDYAWDECGVAATALAMMLGDDLLDWRERWSEEENRRFFKDWELFSASVPTFPAHDLSLLYLGKIAYDSLCMLMNRFLAALPHFRVVLNRAPSLHRYSIMAFRVKLLPFEDGPVLRINPLVCKPFGADFDGDEMSVHIPVEQAEHKEIGQLLSPVVQHNLLSLADGKPLAAFSQDFVLGLYLSGQQSESRKTILDLLPEDCCLTILTSALAWRKAVGEELIAHLCKEHPRAATTVIPAMMRACFHQATLRGTSFGYFDLIQVAEQPPKSKDNKAMEIDAADMVKALATTGQKPAKGFGELSYSGARGDEKQTRQILVARGFLDPGTTNFTINEKDFHIPENLLTGMSCQSAFYAAFNGRSSMVDKKLSTPIAGFIYRKLCLAAAAWKIKAGACQSSASPRKPLSCEWWFDKEICAACYGQIPDGEFVEGFPAGIIAAQSFGERATQLSMQSFHTGQKAVSPMDLNKMLGNPEILAEYSNFQEKIDTFGVYKSLDERHIQVLWRALSLESEAKSLRLDDALFGSGQPQKLENIAKNGAWQAITSSPFLQILFEAFDASDTPPKEEEA